MNDILPENKDNYTVHPFQLGDHICNIYQNKEQLFPQIVPFIADGLNNNQKCLYILDDIPKEELLSEFEKRDVMLSPYFNSKQFVFLTKEDTYKASSIFSPEKEIELLTQAQSTALKEGYTGMRVIGSVMWMSRNTSELDKLYEYELKLHDFFSNNETAAMCLYDEKQFNENTLTQILRTHPELIIYGNYYKNKYFYITPELSGDKNLFADGSYQTIIKTIIEE